ncbi:hypothetical protein EJD97_008945 [Solanum chilense]|uniref:Uncharacterized protein n=1 Tax=Solanum chilense TaxID=4083 RepID=A0A6N2BNZ4_SOLCI|nr:hypothetical protein EJD97_008945 [Solanum chilense]
MNTRIKVGRRVGEAASGRNQARPQAPAARVQVTINPTALTDGDVREALFPMAQAITAQAHVIISQTTKEDSYGENPNARIIARKLRDFTKINPPVYLGSRTDEDHQELGDEVHKFFFLMGVMKGRRLSLMHTSSSMWLRYGTRCR